MPTTRAGGTQRLGSGFAQATLNVSDRLTVVAAAQATALAHRRPPTPASTRRSGSFNPRGSFTYRVNDVVAVRGSAYKGFRAPTLNEFYRGFRVGNTQTNPNEALLPERLKGGDGGLLDQPRRACRPASPASGTFSTTQSPTSHCRARRR